MIILFFITFIDTVVILLLLNANFSESNIPVLSSWFSVGKHTDFSTDWYLDIGEIIIGI
jgi:hypothetical protein